MNSIRVENISKSFGDKQVLKDICFEIPFGEIFGLLGPSGAGKTTLIKIITGQLSYNGNAELLGQECRERSRTIYSEIGMVMDNSGLYERLNAMDNLMLFARIHDIPKDKVIKTLQHVGLHKDTHKAISKFSKGMRQRLVLARAILHQPKVLFLDEPTSGLDPATASEIHGLLEDLKKEGTTIFLTTHNMAEAHKLCSRVALLNEGTIVDMDSPDTLCRKHNRKNTITLLTKNGEEITLPNQPDSAAIIAQYFNQDNVAAIHSSEPNLETVFMSLTGKELDR